MSEKSKAGSGWLIVAGIAGVVMVVSGLMTLTGGVGSTAAVATAPSQLYVTRMVRVRTAATGKDSLILETLQRGAAVSGTWVTGRDGETPWLAIPRADGQDGKGYVWGRNLSTVARPELQTVIDAEWSVRRTTSVSSEAEGGMVLETLAPGDPIHVVGVVEGGDLELLLKKGGVGYIAQTDAGPP